MARNVQDAQALVHDLDEVFTGRELRHDFQFLLTAGHLPLNFI